MTEEEHDGHLPANTMASQSLGQTPGRTHRLLLVQKNHTGEASVVKSERVVTEEASERRDTSGTKIAASTSLASKLDVALIASPVSPENGMGRTSEGNAAPPLANDVEMGDKDKRWPVQRVEAMAQPVKNMAQSPSQLLTRETYGIPITTLNFTLAMQDIDPL